MNTFISGINKLSLLSHSEKNVNEAERYLSALGSGYLLYAALTGNNKNKVVKGYAGAFLLYRALTGHCPVYSSLGKHSVHDYAQNINIRETIFVTKPRNEVYKFWRRLDHLPLFMTHLDSVRSIDEIHSHWTAKIPGLPGKISWEAEIVREEPGKLIGWSSLPGSALDNAGKIDFSDAGNDSTEINTTITYRAPFGRAGEAIARLLSPVFRDMIKEDLRNFKTYMEREALPAGDIK